MVAAEAGVAAVMLDEATMVAEAGGAATAITAPPLVPDAGGTPTAPASAGGDRREIAVTIRTIEDQDQVCRVTGTPFHFVVPFFARFVWRDSQR